MSDLVVLSADKPMEAVVKALLRRTGSLGIRDASCTFLRHFERDGGVRTTGAELLRTVANQHDKALMVLDFEGSGSHADTAAELEAQLDERLRTVWHDRAKCIVIEPELDIWMWGSDARLAQTLAWPGPPSPRDWLGDNGFAFDLAGKPERPKEAMEAVLRRLRKPMSAAIYGNLAATIGLRACTDPAFTRLSATLEAWFGASNDVS